MKESPAIMGEVNPPEITIRVIVELVLHDQVLGRITETLKESEVPESDFSQLVTKICQRVVNQKQT